MPDVTPLHSDDLVAADGRVPGRRGRATRTKLLACTRDMLTTTSYRDVKVIDIAREAGTSPATFYQYFADVEAAILVLAEEMAQEGAHLTEIITKGSWKGRAAYETALLLVDDLLEFWDEHRPVLRVMDLATDEGDHRFQKIRVHLLNDITNALADVARASQARGGLPPDLDPMAVAGTLVSMLAHTAAHQYGFEFWGIRTAQLRESMARPVSWGVTGITPPG
jgi:AcrR family transcriptional regulator